MSHVVSITTELTDLDAIKEACRVLGLTFKAGQKTYQWWGSSVGDYPLPEGFTKEDLGKCEHAIGIPGTTWEIGLARPRVAPGQQAKTPGLRMLFDYFGSWGKPIVAAVGGTPNGKGGYDNLGGKFLQEYAIAKATIEAKRRGYIVRRQPAKNGSVQLVVSGL